MNFRKRDYLILLIVLSFGLSAGIFGRYLAQNKIKASLLRISPSPYVIEGKVIKEGEFFKLKSGTISYTLLSPSPSLDLNQFVDKKVRTNGFLKQSDKSQNPIFTILSIETLK